MVKNGIDFITDGMYQLYCYYNTLTSFYLIDKRPLWDEMLFVPIYKKGLPIIYNHKFKPNSGKNLHTALLHSIGSETMVNIRYGNYAEPKEYAYYRKIKTILENPRKLTP